MVVDDRRSTCLRVSRLITHNDRSQKAKIWRFIPPQHVLIHDATSRPRNQWPRSPCFTKLRHEIHNNDWMMVPRDLQIRWKRRPHKVTRVTPNLYIYNVKNSTYCINGKWTELIVLMGSHTLCMQLVKLYLLSATAWPDQTTHYDHIRTNWQLVHSFKC